MVEDTNKAVLPRSTIRGNLFDDFPYFLLREDQVEVSEVELIHLESIRIKGELSLRSHAKQPIEGLRKTLFLPLLVRGNFIPIPNAWDEVLRSPVVGYSLKQLGIGVSLSQPPDPRSLPVDGPFQRSKPE